MNTIPSSQIQQWRTSFKKDNWSLSKRPSVSNIIASAMQNLNGSAADLHAALRTLDVEKLTRLTGQRTTALERLLRGLDLKLHVVQSNKPWTTKRIGFCLPTVWFGRGEHPTEVVLTTGCRVFPVAILLKCRILSNVAPVILSFYDEATSADILQVMHLVRKEILHHSDAAITASRHNYSAALPWKAFKSPLFRPDGEPESRIVIKTLVPLVRATAAPRLRQAARRRDENASYSEEMKDLVRGKRVLIYIRCSHIQQTDKRSSMERQFQSILGAFLLITCVMYDHAGIHQLIPTPHPRPTCPDATV